MPIRRLLPAVAIFLVTAFSASAFATPLRANSAHSGDYISLLMIGSVSKVEGVSHGSVCTSYNVLDVQSGG